MEKITVLVVEDHTTTRVGLRVELSESPDIEVLDVAGTVREALEKCNRLRPQVTILDLHLPDSTGPKSLITAFTPMTEVVVFSGEGSQAVVRKILELGAAGFVSKSDTTAQLLEAIRAAAKNAKSGGATPVTSQLAIQAPEPFEDPNIGKIFDERYRVVDLLGFGGYGIVYRAEDLMTPRAVALKIMHPHLAMMKDAAARFEREILICQRINHPNVATVYSSGISVTGQPYYAMEFIQGVNLAVELENAGRIEPMRAVNIMRQACLGLQAAHDQGVIHRDVKPANIVLQAGDAVKILDFGLVKSIAGEKGGLQSLTETGSTIGTPCYMSPEQAQGLSLDARSDVYAIGCVLFELLAGHKLFDGPIVDVMLMQATKLPDFTELNKMGIPRDLIVVLDKTLQKDPNRRVRTAAAVAQQFSSILSSEPKQSLFKF